MNIISNALGHVLRIIFELVQNYGLSIILFTIVVKVLLLPLTIKQTKSTKAMQDIQPKILEIQTKYKDKPEKQQQEIILEHEFIHYRRHDLYFKLGLFLVKCIHWFNPLVYIMIQEADKDIEFSCDELILKDASIAYRKEYGRTILAILRSNITKQSTILINQPTLRKMLMYHL